MPVSRREGETVEFKQKWTDRALEDLAAFANSRGGTLLIGVDRTGDVVGAPAGEGDLDRIANVIVTRLGLTPSITVREIEGRTVIEVRVDPARGVVRRGGRYLTRVGATNRDLTPDELARLMLRRSGQSWDGLPSPWTLERVDADAVARFAELAQARVPGVGGDAPERTLQNLGLVRDGRLTNAGVLLFGDRPQELFPHAQVRVGVLRGTDIVDSYDVGGTLWQQLDGVLERFRRVLRVRFDVRPTEPTLAGLRRTETWEYPLAALREAVINALIHRDYAAPGHVQVRILDDGLHVWSPGGLPEGIRLEQLRAPDHPSVPRNPLLAQAFYRAGLIEQWGTGTTRMLAWCREHGLPEPEFREEAGSFRTVFLKDPYTPDRLRALGCNERQVQAVLYVKEHGRITNRDYRRMTGLSDEAARLDLRVLVTRGLLRQRGKGRATAYELGKTGE